MAKTVENKKGFRVIEVSREELAEKLGGAGICDECGETPETGYYIAVLNMWFCETCYNEWTERAEYYPEDAEYEKEQHEWMKMALDMEEENCE